MDDIDKLGIWGSWNGAGTSNSPGPDGPTCTVEQDYCYTSCAQRSGGCHRCDWTTCVDDVAFTEAVIDEIENKLCIDDNRVYGWGFSNGGQFMYELGFRLAHRCRGVCPPRLVLLTLFCKRRNRKQGTSYFCV
eukprot:m.112923 g.112923  ORF g.112923 m.112923 type:complete len:133 (+) comp17051_c0_seq3:1262-1660(+)